MRKGSRVAVDGRLEWREWETAEQQQAPGGERRRRHRPVPRQPRRARGEGELADDGRARRRRADGVGAREDLVFWAFGRRSVRCRRSSVLRSGDAASASRCGPAPLRVQTGRAAARRLDAPDRVDWRAAASPRKEPDRCQSTTQAIGKTYEPIALRGGPREDQGVRPRGGRDQPRPPRRGGGPRGRLRRRRGAADVRRRLQRARRSGRRSSTPRSSSTSR